MEDPVKPANRAPGMTAELPFVPTGYQLLRVLSERPGSWVFIAKNLKEHFCCLKVQRLIHRDNLEALAQTRQSLQEIGKHRAFLPLTEWGADPASCCLWEEMPIADNLLTGKPFIPADLEQYTSLTLHHWVQENGPVPTLQLLEWATDLAEALNKLHEQGLYHRDVKPVNLLLYGGKCVLADYGSVGKAGSTVEFPGTEGYMAPDGMGSPAMDIFALGRSLYEAWTGQDRFQFPSLPPAVTSRPDWATHGWQFNEVLLRAADGRPSNRYRTACQLHVALREATQDRRRISRRTLMVAAATGAGVLGAAYIWRNRPSHRAVWRKISPARFGYEAWSGHELSCDWKQRRIYSLSSSLRLGLSWQTYDLKDWTHGQHDWPQGPEVAHFLLHPETHDLWGVAHRSGKVTRVALDGNEARSISGVAANGERFTGPIYWNPITRRLGKFDGYGEFGIDLDRREFNAVSGGWEMQPVEGPQPWPRMEELLFPGREQKSWFMFGGDGNRSGGQSDRVEGLSGYDGQFYPLDDFWEIDLATHQWRQILAVQRWRPVNLKSAIYHPGLDGVLFLTGSEQGRPQMGRFHWWSGQPDKVPDPVTSIGETIPLFRCWSLLVEPESQDL